MKSFKNKILNNKVVPLVFASALTIGIGISTTANAILVSDPSSYGYYIKQLKQGLQQFKVLQGSLSEAQHLSQGFDGYMQDLRTQFDFVNDIKRGLSSELSVFEDYKRTLSTSSTQSLNFSRKFDMKNLRDVIDTNLDGIYIDPTNPDYNAADMQKLRTIERQRLLKEGLIKTEEKLALLEQKYKDIEALAAKARTTQNAKESADLNNAILLEILAAMHSLIDVTSTLGQAEMASGFINYSKEAHARKEKADKKPSSGYPGFANKREYSQWADGCRVFYQANGHTNTTVNGVDCAQRALRKRFEKQKKELGPSPSWM